MKIYYDLHIHSVLSACSDLLQTPNNILNMCMLKGLNMISICDHNSSKQYETIDKLKDSFDFLVIYGIEITVKEGFHVLAYFEKYSDICALDSLIDESIDKTVTISSLKKNTSKELNEQVVCNEYDLEARVIDYYLNQNLPLSFEEIIPIIKKLNGLVIPSHIERHGTGILDFYPDFSKFDIDGIEIYDLNNYDDLVNKYPFISKYKYIKNSDAHDIQLISEQENYLELKDLSFKSFKEYFKGI